MVYIIVQSCIGVGVGVGIGIGVGINIIGIGIDISIRVYSTGIEVNTWPGIGRITTQGSSHIGIGM